MKPKWIYEPVPQKNIQSIDYQVLNQQQLISISEVEVTSAQLYKQQKIVPNGPLDLRMGVGNKIGVCQTCHRKLEGCPGHFGHFRLCVPVYHIGYLKYLINILKCICKRCGRVLLPIDEKQKFIKKMKALKMNYSGRVAISKKILKECAKHKTCGHCNYLNPSIQKMAKIAGKIQVKQSEKGADVARFLRQRQQQNKSMISAFEDLKNYELSPMEAKQMISRISREEMILLNLDSKLEITNLILQNIIIPPVCIRPSVVNLTNAQSNQDDLTMKLRDAFIVNKKIQNFIKVGDQLSKINKQWFLLQSILAQYINSDTPGLPMQQLGKKSIRSLCVRLKGKQGRFRQNLSGKRSNFTGRTVISPDPNLHPTQVIVPVHMSKILTISVPVTQRSLAFLRGCIENGSKQGGANFVINQEGMRKAVGYGKIDLNLGDIVQRHLRDDDVVIFNRQPSLHRISMMGFRVKISSGNTLRFNECVCTPFNADFDGDEMNIHVPQTLQARSETLHLMGVAQNIMTPKNGQPIIALIQDFLTTAFLITDKDRFYQRDQFCQILSYITDANEKIDLPAPSILKPKCLWTGKQVISSLLRPNRQSKIIINFQLKQKTYTKGEYNCVRDGWVYFKNSQLLLGQLGKITLGGNKNGLLYALIRDNNPQSACQVMHRFSKLSSRWITNFGMTIGISDVTPSAQLSVINKQVIKKSYIDCKNSIQSYEDNTLQIKPGMSAIQSLESALNVNLSKVRQIIGENCIKNLDRYNKPLIMSLCGSKGNPVNLSQMIGCVGQQTVGGKRIQYGFVERTLPHFMRLSKTPEARGFVKNSFYSGLTATQFFFHTMGGRQGLIDTAVKTAETGYMQRRLIKLLEDIAVMYDMTVRTCDKKQIIQFRYGDDGLDPMRTQDPINPINIKNLQLYVKNIIPKRNNQQFLLPEQIIELVKIQITTVKQKKLLPCVQTTQIERLLNNCQNYFLEKANKIKDQYEATKYNLENKDYNYLLNCKHGITKRQIIFFFRKFVEKINKAVMEPGEPVGAITAQSIGEPATQMTLKTFHFAGIASMNITQGVPRINQIINCAPNISTPIVTVHLIDPTLQNAIEVKSDIESLTLSQITHSIQEIYSATGCYLNLELDKSVISELSLKINLNFLKAYLQKLPRTPLDRVEINGENLHFYPLGKSNPIFELKALRKKILQAKISGIDTIKRALISKQAHKNEYIIYGQGLGLKQVLGNLKVCTKNTFSNHISQVYEVLGIQAARKSIINQVGQTMKEHGVTVDPRHIKLLAEVMTCKGKPIGFTRYGVDKMKDSTMMLASFQKTTDFLFDAATQGKHDRMRGVSEKIIIGKPVTIGTGMFDVAHKFNKKVVYSHKRSK